MWIDGWMDGWMALADGGNEIEQDGFLMSVYVCVVVVWCKIEILNFFFFLSQVDGGGKREMRGMGGMGGMGGGWTDGWIEMYGR